MFIPFTGNLGIAHRFFLHAFVRLTVGFGNTEKSSNLRQVGVEIPNQAFLSYMNYVSIMIKSYLTIS